MSKFLAVTMAGLLASGAYAQNPPGASSQEQVITNTKPQDRAQAKDNARTQGKVKPVGGDEVTSPLNDDIGSGKAAAAGQAGVKAREARDPGKNPGQYPTPPNTPGMPASK
ncbi:cell envelope biogenesis protein TolA [Variovorax sp. J22P240]|uniref:cell envelope biogenesis protein TolA n=1 Tax=unclassified Variovorax TaxID=663243 RepID=UPI002578BFDD|nr:MULTISPECIES: cell envelope biogenesis protein TolA [unclassified Variovorax]MDL9999346.1 cell envelope biogenesis protein TolA [Variovorax sp. J22P240]MDM0052538.1 cell envelope biogenesis protein TolA [Variovorax sp. J22R115]